MPSRESPHPPRTPEPPPSPRAARASRRALLRAIPLAVLVAVAGWETVAALRAGSDVPGDAAWQRAAAHVRAEHRPGDLVVFAPRWIDPVGRHHLGDLLSVEDAARMDDARYGTVWELSIRGADAPESAGRAVAWQGSVDGVRIRRLVREPARVVTDFVAAFPRARVTGPAVGRPAVRLEEVGFQPHRCVRVEPRPGQTVTVTYPGAALGRTLVGHVGLADVFTRRDVRDPGRLEVVIDGRAVAAVEVGVDDGWVRFAADTAPGNADVTFSATAVGPRARQRLICFAAEARQ